MREHLGRPARGGGRQHRDGPTDDVGIDTRPAGGHLEELVEKTTDDSDRGWRSLDGDDVTARVDVHSGEAVLDRKEHLVAGTEQGDGRQVCRDDHPVLDEPARRVDLSRRGVGHGQ